MRHVAWMAAAALCSRTFGNRRCEGRARDERQRLPLATRSTVCVHNGFFRAESLDDTRGRREFCRWPTDRRAGGAVLTVVWPM